MKWLGCAALLSVLLQLSGISGVLQAQYTGFDVPLRTVKNDLGPSLHMEPRYKARVTLTCWYYPEMVVKQLLDDGQKGTAGLWLIRLKAGQTPPPCSQAHVPGEQDKSDGFFFMGMKAQRIVLEAPDGDESGGMPFRVLDASSGQELFHDSGYLSRRGLSLSLTTDASGVLTLKYARTVAASCSIPKDGLACWSKLQKEFGLPQNGIPACVGYQKPGQKAWHYGDPGIAPAKLSTESALSFPVRTKLLQRPVITALPGAVRCFPVM